MKIGKMKIENLEAGKVEFMQPSALGNDEDEDVTLIVKVHTPNYVPPGFNVRSRIDEQMFTAESSRAALAAAQQDPNVESLAPARKLRGIKAR